MPNTSDRAHPDHLARPSATPDELRQAAALRRTIAPRLDLCSRDEVRVLDYVLTRLELGRDRYGALDLSRDDRDFAEEERQEHADAVVYRACAELVRLDRVHADLRTLAAQELVENGLAELRDVHIDHRQPCPCGTCIESRFDTHDLGGEAG